MKKFVVGMARYMLGEVRASFSVSFESSLVICLLRSKTCQCGSVIPSCPNNVGLGGFNCAAMAYIISCSRGFHLAPWKAATSALLHKQHPNGYGFLGCVFSHIVNN